ncbi:hypothetical protein [Arsenicicoccus dermatophilus]|uniref:hypothetical protein n=1 Tax=Arsenicicoccus dermatophilus TaxID=1076331 RepID=UPI001F4C60E2|nr:hypothetical protein [Arsenicicoccus dermatophilus]MCH8614167.1 hypothetical protein [Arsenicicoccus dermatophilus]
MIVTAMLVGTGAVAVTAGVGRYARERWRTRHQPTEGRLAPGVALTAAGGALVMSPDVLAAVGQLPVDDPASAVVLALYNVLALGGLGTVGAGMWLSSRRVTRAVRGGVESVVDGIPLVARRRALRRGTPADFPREWAGLVALDTELTHRFLRYERDLEAAVNFPVMTDYTDPLTRGALDAMLRCRELRSPVPPAGTRDVRDTDYARAVADFATALEAAEANAERLVASTFSEDERRVLDEAAATLEFMRAATTTPAERQAAYERVAAQLADFPRRAAGTTATGTAAADPTPTAATTSRASATEAGTPGVRGEQLAVAPDGSVHVVGESGATRVARPHPFLDVEDRARR